MRSQPDGIGRTATRAVEALLTANWEVPSGEQWTVPFGGGVGRLVRFGKQPVDIKLVAYWNAERPENAPGGSLQFTVKCLFPR